MDYVQAGSLQFQLFRLLDNELNVLVDFFFLLAVNLHPFLGGLLYLVDLFLQIVQFKLVELGVFLGQGLLHFLLHFQHLDFFGLQLQLPDFQVLNLELVLELGHIEPRVGNLSHLLDDVGALLENFLVLLLDHFSLHQQHLIFFDGLLLGHFHHALLQTNLDFDVQLILLEFLENLNARLTFSRTSEFSPNEKVKSVISYLKKSKNSLTLFFRVSTSSSAALKLNLFCSCWMICSFLLSSSN